MVIHVVMENETISSIAAEYGVSEARLIFDNQLEADQPLVLGQALVILVPDTIHLVEEGQSIADVANQYGTDEITIYRNNPFLIFDPELIEGESIVISYQGEKLDDMLVDGYAYPYIDEAVLQETLVYLSSFYIFSYGMTMDGELVPVDDERLIEACERMEVDPILVLTSIGEDGRFSSELLHTILTDENVQDRVIENLYDVVVSKGYAGVNVDFEYILAEDRDRFTDFVRRLRATLSPSGYLTSVCLAPKKSADQQGLLYEGMDYPALGEAADYVVCMTYEWGYTYGPAMAVSPINKVREVLDYAVTEITPQKIMMGMSNYGYDWTLPYVRGESQAQTIGNVQAIQIARENNAVIQYDEESQAPFFRYTKDGAEHEVWFEDARSINARLKLVPEYQLGGPIYWQLMRYFRQNFMVVNGLYEILP